MIKQAARVIAENEHAYILETLPQSACPRCEAGNGCGGGILAKAFANKIYQIEVSKLKQLQTLSVNEMLVIGLPESTLVQGSILHYLLPLISMILGASIFSELLGSSDAYTVSGALIGFTVGLVISRLIASTLMNDKLSNPTILKDETQCYYKAN